MDEDKLKKALEDRDFVTKIISLETPEEVQAAFKEDKEIDISIEDIKATSEFIQNQTEGELDEDDLENVAGGFAISALVGGIIIAAAAASGSVTLGKAVNTWTRSRW
ncbi:MAG: class IIb bacteriocin, lactobin A/cerein 7B family [Clostridiales Family XIII bacterium]|jgi:lactobin A/cerein 7B family class IIb bacteriocin|nr:class IIb bacteriocin, lactobin A/cerein 7B family [Clostridiales Family XIII bacterium]